MKKIFYQKTTVIAFSLFFISTLVSCNKEDKTTIDREIHTKSTQLVSYTGTPFEMDDNFSNPFDSIGIYHNILMGHLDSNWNTYKGLDMIHDALINTEIITGRKLSDIGFDRDNFEEYLINELVKDTIGTYMEMIENDLFPYLEKAILNNLMNDIKKVFSNNNSLSEIRFGLQIIEQKVANSEIEPDGKDLALLFCAVGKYSSYNIEYILDNTESNFHKNLHNRLALIANPTKSDQTDDDINIGSAVAADARGVIRGAIQGAQAGAAGGPQGAALMATVGAVCMGSMSTAVNVAVTQKIGKWIKNKIKEIQ